MISDVGAANASAILSSLNSKPGEFKPRSDAAIDIRRTLDQAGGEAARKQMLGSALRRLQGVAEGIIQPQQEWEKVGGFLQLTGQPFEIGIGEDGGIEITPQIESELRDYTPRQRQQLQDAMAELKDLVAAEDLEDTKADLRAELGFAVLRVKDMEEAFAPPEKAWEKHYMRLAEQGVPAKLSLDADGNLFVLNQLEHDFLEVEDDEDRQKLLDAQRDLEAILEGRKAATESWQFEALGNKQDGDGYFLRLDEDGNIDVSRTNIDTVTPEFLEAGPEDGPETSAPWQDEALAIYRRKGSFHLDIDKSDGTIKVVENTYNNVANLARLEEGENRIRSALVSLLA